MNKVIELVEKQIIDGNINLIAECNLYNENGELIQQFSRSPFIFPNTMTDDEIITSIRLNEYSFYF